MVIILTKSINYEQKLTRRFSVLENKYKNKLVEVNCCQ